MTKGKTELRMPGRHERKGLTITEMFRMFPDDEIAEHWFELQRWGKEETRKTSYKQLAAGFLARLTLSSTDSDLHLSLLGGLERASIYGNVAGIGTSIDEGNNGKALQIGAGFAYPLDDMAYIKVDVAFRFAEYCAKLENTRTCASANFLVWSMGFFSIF